MCLQRIAGTNGNCMCLVTLVYLINTFKKIGRALKSWLQQSCFYGLGVLFICHQHKFQLGFLNCLRSKQIYSLWYHIFVQHWQYLFSFIIYCNKNYCILLLVGIEGKFTASSPIFSSSFFPPSNYICHYLEYSECEFSHSSRISDKLMLPANTIFFFFYTWNGSSAADNELKISGSPGTVVWHVQKKNVWWIILVWIKILQKESQILGMLQIFKHTAGLLASQIGAVSTCCAVSFECWQASTFIPFGPSTVPNVIPSLFILNPIPLHLYSAFISWNILQLLGIFWHSARLE